MKASKFLRLKAKNQNKSTVTVEEKVEALPEPIKEVVEEVVSTVEPSDSEVKPVLKKKTLKNA